MDKNKLEVSGKESNSPTSNATYKPIPETEYLEDQALIRMNSHAKNHTSSPEADGAHEKMLADDDSKLTQNAHLSVKIIPSTGSPEKTADGFTLELKPPIVVGMSKEELMKYANDPFWVRLRWTLFICFWLLWAAMLVGAILIIIAAPKCAPPKPKTWWEEGPLTEVNPLIDTADLEALKSNGVQGVIAEWPVDAYEPLEKVTEFKEFLQKANKIGLNVIVGLEPGSSTWHFGDSESKDDAYVNYYIWQNHAKDNESAPPNNWLTPSDTSAWTYSEIRKQFYYAPFGRPWLNFRDPNVQAAFSRVVTTFLDAGVNGIRLTKAPYLLVDEEFANENVGSAVNATVGQYKFYTHHKTMDHPDMGSLLKQWSDIVKNKTENGPFMLTEDLNTLDPYKVNGTLIIDLPRHSQVFNQKMVSGLQIKAAVDSAYVSTLEKHWGVWESSNTGLDRDVIDIVTMLMPGTTIIPMNHTVHKELLTYRKFASIMYGSFETFSIANDTTFVYIRVAAGNPGYVVALNPTDEGVTVNLQDGTKGTVQEEVTIQFHSKNYAVKTAEIKMKIDSRSVVVPPKAAVVLTYVPKA